MLLSSQRHRVLAEMKRDRSLSWPSEGELVRQFISTAKQMYSIEVDEAEARVAVAGRFRD